MTLAQRRKVPGLSNERADIIVPGLAIVNALFDITASQQFLVSGCGVRDVYLCSITNRVTARGN